MPALDELRRAVFPTAVGGAAGGRATASRDVAWVRVLKARVPAFDALDRGDLAILPETALRGPAGALLVGEGDAAPIVAATLRRATELKLPAWRLAGPDPAQVERSVIGYLVNARAELERRAADLEDRLPPPAPQRGRLAGDRGAALLALELARDQAGRRPTEARRRADALPGDGPPWVVLLARPPLAGPRATRA